MPTAQELIAALNLRPHAMEGGYYRETYRSPDRLPTALWPGRYTADKSAGTAIYYLLTPQTFSALHRLPTDEIFHFYLGDPVTMLQLLPDGGGQLVTLGSDILARQSPQVVVPGGVWQGSFLQPGGAFALMGTTVSPGFDFTDYEAGDGTRLAAQYSAFAELIGRLTHTTG
jgi:predicted cupin superfamily sugar epimerase